MSPKNFIEVIPWDPKSASHVERLRQQRMVCGWGVENVDNWRDQQLAQQKLLLWLENDLLFDTAPIIFARQRSNTFIPIGHVSLDFMPTAIIDPSKGQFGATSLYISPALRGLEFARQAVETTRSVGRHYGRFVVAEAPVRESDEAVERYEKFGDGRPRFSIADWYESMGWRRLKEDKRVVTEIDSEGRIWNVELVSLEWDLWGDGIAEKSRF
ncbi:hypothetical protein L207DRAFT_582553 [Hyaloscypha variabilis F]|uniref:N-acetyltransferase domain-containing protein n=1 Tax=Hyaloscypha variabilis (strain UAMH 11265 / GT02V1 / F) TaxID=1149755 RepID=A0A2J6RPA6_HYAVF|nr:hypothetical protein L207DRAFT_582553 [Hyaloscypha variabilis F]